MQLVMKMKVFALIVASILIAIQAQRLPLPEGCTIPCIDGVFVLDVSNSIPSEADFQLMKDFVAATFDLVTIAPNCSRAGLILFASDARIEFNLTEYTDEASLRNALDSVTLRRVRRFRQGTNTPAALNLMRTAAEDGSLGLSDDRQRIVRVAVFITDGRPSLGHIRPTPPEVADQLTEQAGTRLHRSGAYDEIYAIGIQGGRGEIRDTLRFIADSPDRVFPLESFSQELFREAADNITRQFCDPCILSPCPPGSICKVCNDTRETYCEYTCAVDNGGCDPGNRCIEVDVPTCSPGQCCSPVNITCQRCDVGKIDCVYVLDVSLSIQNETNFGFMRDLVIQSARQSVIGENDVLFSLILFARQANIIFNISQHTNSADLITAINQISYFDTPELNRTGTNIPEALDLVREAGQDGRLGLRPDAVYRHVVFITDGRPNTISLAEERLGMRLRGQDRQDQLDRDAENSITAARRLHESGIYNDAYAIGIRGQRDINIVELNSIASRPDLKFQIENFTIQAFQAVIQPLLEEICSNPCTQFPCPRGSVCRVCEETGMPYCEFSCLLDNGGCPVNASCRETSTCAPGECCSPNITCVEGCTIPCIDGVFVLDVSNSIPSEADFQLMKDFVAATFDLVTIAPNCSRAGLILFASDARIEFNLTEYTDEASLRNALDSVTLRRVRRFRQGTNTPAALNLMRTAAENGSLGLSDDRQRIVRVAVFITDGRPSLGHIEPTPPEVADQLTEQAGTRLHRSGAYDEIYAIGIQGGRGEIRDTLRFIADSPDRIFPLGNFSQELFREAADNITRQFCDPCILSPCPPGSICRVCNDTREAYCVYTCADDNGGCDPGNRCIEVNVPTCSPDQCCSPVNITCQRCDVGKIDCVYVLDVSLSIQNETNFGFMRDLVIQSARQSVIGENDVLFSLILFARQANIIFNISQHTNSADLITAINQISYFDTPDLNRTGTNIPEALDLVREAGQDGRLGLRPDAVYRHVVFITDGRPNTISLAEERLGMRLRGQDRQDQLDRDAENSITAARRLHESGIYNDTYAIGIRGQRDIDIVELNSIASRPDLKFQIENFTIQAFQAVIQPLLEEICDPCTQFPCPRGSVCKVCNDTREAYCEYTCADDNGGCDEGSQCIEVDVPTCSPGQCCSPVNITCQVCEVISDFVFVLDVSNSIGSNENFQQITNFVSMLGRFFDIGIEDNLAGVILFARNASILFDVQEHTNSSDFRAAINSIDYERIPRRNRQGTNLPAALDLLRTAGRQGGNLRLRDDPDVQKIAVILTDGRPNQVGNPFDVSVRNTEAAAARLQESGIYDQIYGIGIRGNREINFEELRFIASDPALALVVEDFTVEFFNQIQGQLTAAICGRQQCTARGQVFLPQALPPECQRTCTNPTRVCSNTTIRGPGCTCPQGTVLDEIQNRCVQLSQCTCVPQCSHDYCSSPLVQSSDTLIPCMRGPPPYTEANCTDDCQLTYCQACYYYPNPRPSPPGCSRYRIVSKGCSCCLREWARCVERLNRRDNECTGRDCQIPDNFRCYDYPLCI